jgi:hypothetical protein
MIMFDEENRLQFDVSSDAIFVPWKNMSAKLKHELDNVKFNNGGADVLTPPAKLNGFKGNLFIWGHGNYRDIISGGVQGNNNNNNNNGNNNNNADKDVAINARQLAQVLSDCGLPQSYAGNIIVWTCWGGVPGGLAQCLLIYLRNKGYHTVTVWGARSVTFTMYGKRLYVLPDTHMKVVGDTEDAPFGTGMETTGQMTEENVRCATRDDLIGYPT